MDQKLYFKILTEVVGEDKVDEFKRKLQDVGDTSQKSKSKLVDFAAATYLIEKGHQVARAAVSQFLGVINYGDELQAMSERTGIAAQALSGYKAAADQANLSFEDLQKLLGKFTQSLGDVNNEKMQNALKALGVNAIDPTTNRLRSASAVIDDVAAKFERMEDGPRKAAIAVDLFGKTGSSMIPFLNQGRDALHKFGLQFSDSFAANADAFNDNMALIGVAIRQHMVDGIDAALPKMLAFENALTDMLQREKESSGGMGSSLANGLARTADLLNQLRLSFTDFGDWVKALFERLGGIVGGMMSQIVNFVSGVGETIVTAGKASLGMESFGSVAESMRRLKDEYLAVNDSWKEGDQRIDDEFSKRSNARQASLEKFHAAMEKLIAGEDLPSGKGKKRSGSAPDIPEDKYKQQHEAVQKFIAAQKAEIAVGKLKLENYALTSAELQKLTIAEQLRGQAEKESIGWTAKAKDEMRHATEEIIAQKQALIDLQEQQKRSFTVGAKTAMRDYLETIQDVATQTKDLFTHAFQGMEDALVKFVRTGKMNFDDLANAIMDDLARIAVRQATLGIVTSIGTAFAGSAAGASTASAGESYSNVSMSTAANGNVITRDGPMPLSRFAKGGVVDRAHVAIFGEAGAEAFVPLPDGRSIPVTMRGAAGGGNFSVIVNVNMASGEEKVSGPADGQALGSALAAAVRAELVNQKRPGGLLA